MIIALVAMMLKHQRAMAELIHANTGVNAGQEHEIAALKSEIEQLKSALYDHSTSIDDNVRALGKRVERVESESHLREAQ
jgi:hypothetical protein